MPKSLYINVSSSPSIDRMDALMIISNNGIIMGRLKTGINKLLFPAFEEIADNIVNVLAKPIQPKTVTMIYKPTD